MHESDSTAVVIATFQRPELLQRTLLALEAQTVRPDEVVVVDDDSGDATSDVLDAAERDSTLPLRVIRLTRNSGPAVARNEGWRCSTADIIAFTDDDCRPDARWLERLSQAMHDADVVQGRVRPDPEQVGRGAPFSRSLDVGGSPFFETANIAYRRELLERLGGFDTQYRFQGGEDTDLGQRARELGAEIRYEPEALVFHEVFPLDVMGAIRHAGRCDQLIQVVVQHASLQQFFTTRLFLLPHHPATIAAAGGAVLAIAGVLRGITSDRHALAGATFAAGAVSAAPWARFRIRRRPTVSHRLERIAYLPAQLLVDLTEIAVVLRARARYRGLSEVTGGGGYAPSSHERSR